MLALFMYNWVLGQVGCRNIIYKNLDKIFNWNVNLAH